MPVLSNDIRENFVGFSHDTEKPLTELWGDPVMYDVFYVHYKKPRWLRSPLNIEEKFTFKRKTTFIGWQNTDKKYQFDMTNRAREFLAQLKYLSGINDHKDSLFDYLDKLASDYSVNDDFGAGVIHAAEKVREFLKEQQDEKA